jgi:hypothetical protein
MLNLSRRNGITLFLAIAGVAGWSAYAYNKSIPLIPVEFTTRPSAVGEGLVGQFRNNSDRYLTVKVALANGTTGGHEDRVLDLNPHAMVEVGWMEGWKFMSSETVTLSHQDYRSLCYRVP